MMRKFGIWILAMLMAFMPACAGAEEPAADAAGALVELLEPQAARERVMAAASSRAPNFFMFIIKSSIWDRVPNLVC